MYRNYFIYECEREYNDKIFENTNIEYVFQQIKTERKKNMITNNLGKDKNIAIIKEVANKFNYDAGTLLAMAHIETGGKFDNAIASKSGSYVGLFQLSNGIGGLKGDERKDPYLATAAAIKYIEYHRERFKKNGIVMIDFYVYLAHQQGFAGALSIIRTPNDKISTHKRKKAMMGNLPSSVAKTAIYVKDYLSYWENRFVELKKLYTQNSLSDNYISEMNKIKFRYL